MKSFLLAISIFAATAWVGGDDLLAEEPYVQWVKTPCGSGYHGDSYLTSDANGGVIAWDRYGGALVHLNARGGTISSNQVSGAGRWLAGLDGAANQYWVGRIGAQGTFDFPNVGGFFVAKVSPTGQFAWIRNNEMPESTSGSFDQWTYSSGTGKTDRFGNVAVAGTTIGPFKMQSLEWDGARLPFVCKVDPNGNVLWGRKVACTPADQSNRSYGLSLAVDLAGNIFVSGWIEAGTADFGGITVYPGANWSPMGGTAGGWGDYFVVKYTPDGQLLWVTLGYGSDMAVGPQGEVYAVFHRSDGIANSSWGLARLGPGGTVLWEKLLSPAMNDVISLAVDPLGRPVFAGAFSGTLQLDGITLRSRTPDALDIVVAKADADGHTLWAIAGGGSSWDGAGNVVCDAQGDIFVGGTYDTSATFDGWLLRATNPPDPTAIPFVAKISEKPSLALARIAQGVQLTWPAKATNYVLEASTSLPAVSWTPVTNAPTVIGRDRNLQLPATGNANFFRLRKP